MGPSGPHHPSPTSQGEGACNGSLLSPATSESFFQPSASAAGLLAWQLAAEVLPTPDKRCWGDRKHLQVVQEEATSSLSDHYTPGLKHLEDIDLRVLRSIGKTDFSPILIVKICELRLC